MGLTSQHQISLVNPIRLGFPTNSSVKNRIKHLGIQYWFDETHIYISFLSINGIWLTRKGGMEALRWSTMEELEIWSTFTLQGRTRVFIWPHGHLLYTHNFYKTQNFSNFWGSKPPERIEMDPKGGE